LIGVDTNVILRLFTEDDLRQRKAAEKYIRTHCNDQNPAYVNRIALTEMVWVLESGYCYPRSDIATLLDTLLGTADFAVEDDECVRHAARAYRDGADFADALIAATNEFAGCAATVTFDRAAAKKDSRFTEILAP
jgi:predicted nucleic-acid-binding protein